MADQHTGGMIALIPRDEDAATLAVRGGDKPGELHLTLIYLGDDVSAMSPVERSAAIAAAAQAAAGIGPVTANAMGHAVFNPNGDGDKDPCAVYLISDSPVLSPLRNALAQHAATGQHEPYIPHVTAGYGVPVRRLAYTGGVVFDRLRIALADQVLDLPLGNADAIKSLVDGKGTSRPSRAADPYSETKMFSFIALESKVTSQNPNAVKLRQWWAHEGMKLWGGKFTTLVKALRKHTPIKNPKILKGLAANIYHLALGQWPGRHDRKMAYGWLDVECKAAAALESKSHELASDELFRQYKAMREELDAATADDEEEPLDDAESAVDGEDMTPEEAYAAGLADDIDWTLEGDGTLEDPDNPDEDATALEEDEPEGAPEIEPDADDVSESEPEASAVEEDPAEEAAESPAEEEAEGPTDAGSEEDPEDDEAALDELDDLFDLVPTAAH